MENNNKYPVLELRQDDVVAIPIERYEQLVMAETRLSIIRSRRIDEILNFKSYTYKSDEDYILGPSVAMAWEERERLIAEYRVMTSDEEKE